MIQRIIVAKEEFCINPLKDIWILNYSRKSFELTL